MSATADQRSGNGLRTLVVVLVGLEALVMVGLAVFLVVDAVGVGEHGGRVDRVMALTEHLGRDDELLVLDGLRRPRAAVFCSPKGTHSVASVPAARCRRSKVSKSSVRAWIST